MDKEYRYILAPWSGKDSRLVCPNCGKRDLVPYIDTETGDILDPTCGRCNHESSCQYHLTPREFFQQNPGARPQGDAWREPPEWLKRPRNAPRTSQSTPKEPATICELPKEVVSKTIRVAPASNFVKFLDTLFDPLVVEGIVFDYNLGVTKAGETIFYQQDSAGRYRGGKVIQYDPASGHRIKDTDFPVHWVTSAFQKKGFIPPTWKMTQCLFGEHLLGSAPNRDVCLVEAEKSACICSAFIPDCIWVATGGKNQLGPKLDVLRNRSVTVYPDIDGYEAWKSYFNPSDWPNVEVSDLVERMATLEERAANADIADIIIRVLRQDCSVPLVPAVPSQVGTERSSDQRADPVMSYLAQYLSPESLPEVTSLIEDLDLELVSISRVIPEENENTDR